MIPGDGLAGDDAARDVQERLEKIMRTLTGGDLERPIVTLSWNAENWGGRNLALRLVKLGYRQVHWYRGGREAWESFGLPVAPARLLE